jgi:glyoxylase-like metal-dependent hydrolase (beta-lactamase superfamily II)
MANKFKIGDLAVTVVSDGEAGAPGTMYFQGTTAEQWEPHKRWLDHEGNVKFPFSCFVVQSGDRTVLIDTGLGPVNMFGFTGGALLTELASAGFKAEDIDTVFITHLHIDHAGNVALPDGDKHKVTFPKATYMWSSDEDKFWRSADAGALGRAGAADMMPKMFAAVEGKFKAADDGDIIAPGMNAIATPGHTPGHAGVILSSGGERAFILGDAISCPVQLEEPEWSGMGDMDKDLARRTQEAVAKEAESSGALLTAAHFPGLTFGRVLAGKGKRYWEPVQPAK